MRTQRLMGCVWALLASVAVVGSPAAWALAHGPQWTIGRAVIVLEQGGMSMQRGLYLKLSLRNVGTPGRTPVRIFGRWAVRPAPTVRRDMTAPRPSGYGDVSGWGGPGRRTPEPGAGRWSAPVGTSAPRQATGQTGWNARQPARRPTGGLPPGMRLLGRYSREVSLNQTAILEVSLAELGAPRRDTGRLEVVVMTDSVITDHQFVNLAPD